MNRRPAISSFNFPCSWRGCKEYFWFCITSVNRTKDTRVNWIFVEPRNQLFTWTMFDKSPRNARVSGYLPLVHSHPASKLPYAPALRPTPLRQCENRRKKYREPGICCVYFSNQNNTFVTINAKTSGAWNIAVLLIDFLDCATPWIPCCFFRIQKVFSQRWQKSNLLHAMPNLGRTQVLSTFFTNRRKTILLLLNLGAGIFGFWSSNIRHKYQQSGAHKEI